MTRSIREILAEDFAGKARIKRDRQNLKHMVDTHHGDVVKLEKQLEAARAKHSKAVEAHQYHIDKYGATRKD
ncbi:MAG: hypothetical protein ACREQ5_05215 [Candidatus Dormibacteria bacterium]